MSAHCKNLQGQLHFLLALISPLHSPADGHQDDEGAAGSTWGGARSDATRLTAASREAVVKTEAVFSRMQMARQEARDAGWNMEKPQLGIKTLLFIYLCWQEGGQTLEQGPEQLCNLFHGRCSKLSSLHNLILLNMAWGGGWDWITSRDPFQLTWFHDLWYLSGSGICN